MKANKSCFFNYGSTQHLKLWQNLMGNPGLKIILEIKDWKSKKSYYAYHGGNGKIKLSPQKEFSVKIKILNPVPKNQNLQVQSSGTTTSPENPTLGPQEKTNGESPELQEKDSEYHEIIPDSGDNRYFWIKIFRELCSKTLCAHE